MIIGARSGRLDEVLRGFMKPEFLAPGPQRLAVLNQVFEMGRDLGPDVMVRQVRALQRRRDQQPTLRRCKVPTLILCGAHDTLTPLKRHAFMAELIPYAKLEVIEDAGHLPTLEAPEAVTAALRGWLKQPFVLQ
jgi:pimeloyl-ACP methyl ester carboxylesterase